MTKIMWSVSYSLNFKLSGMFVYTREGKIIDTKSIRGNFYNYLISGIVSFRLYREFRGGIRNADRWIGCGFYYRKSGSYR